MYAMKAYGTAQVQLQLILNLSINGNQLAARPTYSLLTVLTTLSLILIHKTALVNQL